MNKKIMISVGIIFVIIFFMILIFVVPGTSKNGSKKIELTMKTNGGVPYDWEYVIEDESVVKFVETKDITSEKDKKLDGGPVYINYIFKGLKEGKTTITFKYVSIKDGSINEEKKYIVKVDNHRNVSIVSNLND